MHVEEIRCGGCERIEVAQDMWSKDEVGPSFGIKFRLVSRDRAGS